MANAEASRVSRLSLSLTVESEAEASNIRPLSAGRTGADAVNENVLLTEFRHAGRQVRRWLDGLCSAKG